MAKPAKEFFNSLNIFAQCRRYQIKLWQCPQFLFVVMGTVIIAAIIFSNIAARYYTEPEIAALIVLAVAALLFGVGHTIINSFQRMAESVIAKSEFISIVSHQLRSPLSTIGWQLDLISNKQAEANSRDLQSSLDIIEDQNRRMTRIVNDLLKLNRIEENDLKLHPRPFSLKELAESVAKEYQYFASASNIALKLFLPADLPDVFADYDHLKSIAENFIDNAIRYSRGKGEAVITIERADDFLRFSVADQGVGIPQEDSERIFTKFFRSSNASRYQTEGTGIGLYIAKKIIEASGGSVGFISIEGKGSTFWFTLPIAKSDRSHQ